LIWGNSLTELIIDRFAQDSSRQRSTGITNTQQIETLASFRVLKRLTLSNIAGPKYLSNLAYHPKLPSTLTDISWKWDPSRGRRMLDLVRQSFALRGIMYHHIGEDWQP
jgi:hypothetical protein